MKMKYEKDISFLEARKIVEYYMKFSTGWNDKIVTLEKTTWFNFHSMKTGFLFFLQTIY